MRGRRLHRDQQGVAAVIGTLLALLVFLTLFGIFLTQFVPLWMADNEYAFATTVAGQMGQVKQCMDLLALWNTAGKSCTTPVTMQSNGIPVFASPTQGSLSFQQIPQLYTNISFQVSYAHNFYENISPAEIIMTLPDRYYVPLSYILSLGALIQDQSNNQQSMLYQPSIESSVTGNSVSLSMAFYAMYGNTTFLSSTGTNEVYLSYLGGSSYSTSGVKVNVTLDTYYPCAWTSYLSSTFKGTSDVPSFWSGACPSSVTNGKLYTVRAVFPATTTFSLAISDFSVLMGVGNAP